MAKISARGARELCKSETSWLDGGHGTEYKHVYVLRTDGVVLYRMATKSTSTFAHNGKFDVYHRSGHYSVCGKVPESHRADRFAMSRWFETWSQRMLNRCIDLHAADMAEAV